jgi:hypothetical protein
MIGLTRGLSTQEVLAWRDRILRGAPKRPRLDEMTLPQLLDRFIDACERCYGSTCFLTDEQGGGSDMRAYDKASGESYAVARELNARGKLASLVPLLDHTLVTVREKAGMFCLDIAPDKAIATLEAVGRADSLLLICVIIFISLMTLAFGTISLTPATNALLARLLLVAFFVSLSG